MARRGGGRRPGRSGRPSSRPATCAPATPGRTATSIRPTTRPSSSSTTSARSARTRRWRRSTDGLLRAEGERGECRVVCFSPRHDLTLGAMSPGEVRRVVDLWADQTAELGERYRWVQVFENRGAAMGASNPHPHGQIWAGTALPATAPRARPPPSAPTSRRPAVACCSTTSPRNPAARGSSSSRRSGWPSSRSGRPGRSRRCSSRSARRPA